MQRRRRLNRLAAFGILILLIVQARPALADELFRADDWLALVHYQDRWLGPKGAADTTDFYLSPQGRTDPREELEATKRLLGSSLEARCAWPARAAFLARHGFPVVAGDCPDFRKFKEKLAVKSVTFVFADAYPNNPASMFGHALLRLNRENKGAAGGADLLNNSVAFLAKTDPNDDPLSYTTKGLFGGYPGFYSIDPYYTTVTLYNDGESRDLWEYDLDLTPEEIDFMVAHLWELATKASFDYYFYDENCAYQLLALLEAVRPASRLTERTRFFVMPLDTVRDVHAAFGQASEPRRRPSLKTEMLKAVDALRTEQRRVFDEVRNGERPASDVADAATADAVVSYVNYVMYDSKGLDPKGRALQHAMNVRRAQLGAEAKPALPEEAATSPDLGHAPVRVALSAGRVMHGSGYLELAARPGFHDLLNDDRGYGSFAAIHYLDLHLRAEQETKKVQFEQLTVAEVTSLTPFDSLTKPWSWRLGLMLQRIPESLDAEAREVRGEAAGGLTIAAPSNHIAAYVLANAVAEIGKDFGGGSRAGPGLVSGVIVRAFGGAAKWATEAYALKDLTGDEDSRGLTTGAAWSLSRFLDVRAEGRWLRVWSADSWTRDLQAGLGWQF